MILHWGLPNMVTGYAAPKNGSLDAQKRFTLIPGNNEIPDADWVDIKKHPLIKSYMDSGTLKEVTKPEKDNKKAREGLAQYDLQVAQEIIKGTYDLNLLRGWREKDSRDGIHAAIDAQLKSIEDKTRKPTKDEDDEDEE